MNPYSKLTVQIRIPKYLKFLLRDEALRGYNSIPAAIVGILLKNYSNLETKKMIGYVKSQDDYGGDDGSLNYINNDNDIEASYVGPLGSDDDEDEDEDEDKIQYWHPFKPGNIVIYDDEEVEVFAIEPDYVHVHTSLGDKKVGVWEKKLRDRK